MATLSITTVLALASACQSLVSPAMIAGIAQHESGLDPRAIHRNADGSLDMGLTQINDRNFAWLGLTPVTALDPCRNIAAAAQLLASLSRYNTGSPDRGIVNGYASKVTQAVARVRASMPHGPSEPVTSSPDPFVRPERSVRGLLLSTTTNRK